MNAIFKAKGRPNDNPLIVHIADLSALPDVVSVVPEKARVLMERFWPGPLTIVLPRNPQIPNETTAGLDTVAVRMPSHPVAQAIIRESGLPIAAPSANLSGLPSPTTAEHCVRDLTGKVSAIVDGRPLQLRRGIHRHHPGRGPSPAAASRRRDPGTAGSRHWRGGSGPCCHRSAGGWTGGSLPGHEIQALFPQSTGLSGAGQCRELPEVCQAFRERISMPWSLPGKARGLRKPFREYGAETDHLMQARELFWLLREV